MDVGYRFHQHCAQCLKSRQGSRLGLNSTALLSSKDLSDSLAEPGAQLARFARFAQFAQFAQFAGFKPFLN